MKIQIKVQPRSSREEILKINENSYKIYMHKPAVDGMANKHLIEMITTHFKTKKSKVRILNGMKSRNKIIEWEK